MWNQFKTVILLGLLTGVLLVVGQLLGGMQGLTIAFALAIIMNVGSYFFSHKLVLRMYRAKEASKSEYPKLHKMVEDVSMKAGIPKPKVYIVPTDTPNAFATGRNPNHAAVAVTTGIMRILTREELQGVIGHELAHIKHRDILISTIAATIAGAISFLAQMAQWAMIFGGHRGDDNEGGNPIAALVMMIVGPIAAVIIQMAISRSREYAADAGGAKIAGNPRYLSGALKKLHMASQKIPMKANPSTSHMFIVNPLSGGGLLKLFSTHPPIEERISKLNSMSL